MSINTYVEDLGKEIIQKTKYDNYLQDKICG